ncbi:hypothetical protein RHOSPDRAFT_29176 [Rhodotorula sp. JG-1b]|nr:hypothetical protein RHOSPDRAFT_29176 [Rhodotorula sp. JG-1b]
MKYGKQYLESLENVPEEWRQQAIEYRRLKKVINRVANELKELGLTSDVLRDLLHSKKAASPPKPTDAPLHGRSQVHWTDGSSPDGPTASGSGDQDDEKRGEVQAGVQEALDHAASELAEASEADLTEIEGLSEKARGKRKATRKRRVHATYEVRGTAANPEPCIHLVFSSCSSTSASESDSQANSRDDSEETSGSPANFLFKRRARRRSTASVETARGRIGEGEGEEANPAEPPTSQKGSASTSPPSGPARQGDTPETTSEGSSTGAVDGFDATESSGSVAEDIEPDDDIEFEGAGPQANALLRRMYGVGRRWSEDEDGPTIVELDEDGEHAEHVEAMKRLAAEEANKHLKEGANSARPPPPPPRVKRTISQDTLKSKATRRKRRGRQHRREVYIPLTSDTEFLTLLASALNSLATLQLAQKRQFTESVQMLAREVSAVSSPSRPKSDLYIWREIFALWIEAEIFESSRERDRGERSIEEVEKHLEWFVDQVAKRKLAKRMKHKESRVALEKFIALNVELLDLKKFQIANEEAARKILKKHDKRTALTASLGFPQLIGKDSSNWISTELISRAADGGQSRPVLTLPGFPSLPHILLSTFTSTLLPVIPTIEDYECLICGDIAFKPIRLNCGHRFCVRCLVKMQKRGQDQCPQCRSAVVLRANASNLDTDMLKYLQEWFPREIKAKEKANQKEAAREELEEMGLKEHKCLLM